MDARLHFTGRPREGLSGNRNGRTDYRSVWGGATGDSKSTVILNSAPFHGIC
jgi:hypothetical protein